MCAAGWPRALNTFEWPVVLRSYQDVWHEQELLRSHANVQNKVPARINPGFLNPLSLFDHYLGGHLLSKTVVCAAHGIGRQDVIDIRRLRMWGFARSWLAPAEGIVMAWSKVFIRDWARQCSWPDAYALNQVSWMLKMSLLKLDAGIDS